MSVRAVIFDLGGVLVKVVIGPEFRRLFDWEKGKEAGTWHRFDRLYTAFARGNFGAREFYRSIRPLMRQPVTYREFSRLWCSVLQPLPGASALFLRVAARLPVGLLSDTDPLHWRHARQTFPFLQHIRRPTLSFRTGFLKPHPRAFLLAAAALKQPPQHCLFIDDKEQNVEGARRAGLQAICFPGIAKLAAELTRRGVLSVVSYRRAPAGNARPADGVRRGGRATAPAGRRVRRGCRR